MIQKIKSIESILENAMGISIFAKFVEKNLRLLTMVGQESIVTNVRPMRTKIVLMLRLLP